MEEKHSVTFRMDGRKLDITIDPETNVVTMTEDLEGDTATTTATIAELYAALHFYEQRNNGQLARYRVIH